MTRTLGLISYEKGTLSSSLCTHEYCNIGRRKKTREKFSPFKHGEDRFKRSWRTIKSLNYGQCRDENTATCAHVRSSVRSRTQSYASRYCYARTTRRRVNANISPISVILNESQAPFAPLLRADRCVSHMYSFLSHFFRIMSPCVCNFDTLLHAFIPHHWRISFPCILDLTFLEKKLRGT